MHHYIISGMNFVVVHVLTTRCHYTILNSSLNRPSVCFYHFCWPVFLPSTRPPPASLLSQHPPLLPGHCPVRFVHHDPVPGVLPLQESETRAGAGAAGGREQEHILHPLPEEPVPTGQWRPPGGAAAQPGGPHASAVQLRLPGGPAGLQRGDWINQATLTQLWWQRFKGPMCNILF